jgi:glycosyltransferase involved in cell wall biosynthesis
MMPPLSSDETWFRPAVVAPTFNNARTLMEVLHRLDRLGLAVLVVNDGSTDATGDLLEDWARNGNDRRVLTHPRNRGKAAALLTGFAAAMAGGFSHAVTIDTDGQLSPEDIPALLESAAAAPTALVIGHRDASAADYPLCSRIGRRLSNFMIFLESGLRVADSQCGLRVYPLALVNALPCRAGHFGFETEIVTRAAWAGASVVNRPVDCTYGPRPLRVSHFKPWLDTPRAIRMHARLLVGAAGLRWAKGPISRPPHTVPGLSTIRPALQPQVQVSADGQG